MKGFRLGLSLLLALFAVACGNGGSVKSPDFEPVLKSITISVASGSTTLGASETAQLKALGTFTGPPDQGETTRDITDSVNWSSTDTAVIALDGNGVATGGTKAGTVSITASKDGVTSNALSFTGLGAALREVVVTPKTRTISPSGQQEFQALGVYYGSDAQQPINGTITWTSSDTGVATVTQSGAKTLATPAGKLGMTTIKASVGSLSDSATLTVANLTLLSLAVEPATMSLPLGDSSRFVAQATFGINSPDSSGETTTEPVDATWTLGNPDVATISSTAGSSNGVVTTKQRGASTVTAKYTDPEHPSVTLSANASLTVTDPVLKSLQITPKNPSVPAGATQDFVAKAVYSDTSGAAIDVRDTDTVTWTSSSTSIATLSPAQGASSTATSKAAGQTTITATSGALSDSTTLTVTAAVVQSLLRIEPSSAVVPKGSSTPFTVIGKFSDGSEAPVDNAALSWSTDDSTIATIDATGKATGVAVGQTSVKATLNSGGGTVSATLIVTDEVCSTPLRLDQGAEAKGATLGLCLLCGVTNPDNAIDADLATFASVNVPVGLLDASASLIVKATQDAPPLYTLPFAAGSKPGFIISRPVGSLVLAEVLSQIEVSTLLGEAPQESSGALVPLRVDLLGLPLIDGTAEQALVSITTTVPFDSVQVKLKSGAASALTNVRVFAACGNTLPPPPPAPLLRVDHIVPATPSVEAGSAARFTAIGYYADGVEREIQDADVDWSSSTPATATIVANGLATGVAPGTTTITAKLKSGVSSTVTGDLRDASTTLTVTDAVCTTPFTAAAGATVETDTTGLCLLCSLTGASNIIDGLAKTSATAYVPVGLLGAAQTITVKSNTTTTPSTGGQATGFVIGQPVGKLLTAQLFPLVTVSTLLGNEVQETSSAVNLLHLDLLGIDLTGDNDQALASFVATKPYNGVRLTLNSGLATALDKVQIYSACAAVKPPTTTP